MKEGIVISQDNGKHELILDPNKKVRHKDNTLVSISHAHSDHVRKHEARVLCTPETSCLMPFEAKVRKKYWEEIEFDGMTVTQANANHILGSSQLVIDTKDERIVYTGDFRLKESMLGKAEIIEADTIIIESTYGLPKFRFPEIREVQSQLIDWIEREKQKGNNVLLGAYSLGKAQEVTKLLNESGEKPLVNEQIAYYNNIYKKNKVNLEYYTTEKDEEVKEAPFTAVTQHNKIKEEARRLSSETGRKTSTAVLTGWSSLYNFTGIHKTFQLPDHADFYQILEYVENAKPRKVLTVHGYSKQLAKIIEKLFSIKAKPLE